MVEGTISAEDLAQIAGVSTRWIAKLTRDGIIPAPKAGQFPLAETLTKLIAYFRAASEGVGESLSTERARLTKSKADIAELQRARMLGEVVPLNEVVAMGTSIIAAAKAKILTTPTKLAQQMAITNVPAKCEALMRQSLEEALEELERLKVVRQSDAPRGRGRPRKPDSAAA